MNNKNTNGKYFVLRGDKCFKKALIASVQSLFLALFILCHPAFASISTTSPKNQKIKQTQPKPQPVKKSPVSNSQNSLQSSFQKVKNYLDNDRETNAMIELDKIRFSSAGNSKWHSLYAQVLLKKCMIEEAESAAKKSITLLYNNSEAFEVLGNIYMEKALSLENTAQNQDMKRNYLSKSFESFYTAQNYNPASPYPHIGLANAYYINSQTALAQDEILKARELSTNNANALYLMGEYFYKTKDYTKAKTLFQKSVSAGLNSRYKTYYLLGTIYEQEGQIEEAQKNYLQSLKLKPDHSLSQQNLDRLIKISYSEAQEVSQRKANTKDLFENLNNELNTVMQADNYLILDEFTRARDGYIKVLSQTPSNTNAASGLAELYYAKWAEGFAISSDFVNDSKYILNMKESSRTAIPLAKFKMINEDSMPESVRGKLINLSVSETFDFYDLLNEVRAEFLLGNFQQNHDKLQKLLEIKLSNYEKFKVLKSLCYDHNFDEAFNLIAELRRTYYHNAELEPIYNRIKAKYVVAEDKLNEAIVLYSGKDKKNRDFSEAETIIKQTIRYFPAYKKAYLHYAFLLQKQGKIKQASEKAQVLLKLMKLYPENNFGVSESDVKKFIQELGN